MSCTSKGQESVSAPCQREHKGHSLSCWFKPICRQPWCDRMLIMLPLHHLEWFSWLVMQRVTQCSAFTPSLPLCVYLFCRRLSDIRLPIALQPYHCPCVYTSSPGDSRIFDCLSRFNLITCHSSFDTLAGLLSALRLLSRPEVSRCVRKDGWLRQLSCQPVSALTGHSRTCSTPGTLS